MPTQLPPKENTLFKRILKCYEQKQYKNGLKFCKTILSNPKYAEHGETLAMKGLTLNYMGRKEEAYDYVRRGLRNDLKSHVCWHVYGLLQRADHKYDEAIKCYRNALKWDKENIQILRDLSLLQVQMRDLEGFRDTRYQLLKIRPAQRQSWIGYSISYYLTDDYDMAFSIMDEFRKTLYQENQTKPASAGGDIEHSEMLLFQNMILKDLGKHDECLKHLDGFQQHITDKLKVQELRGSLNIELGNFGSAEKIYKDLIKRNPENWSYYESLEVCLARQSGDEALNNTDRLALYLKYRKRYPRAESPKRIPLDFTTGSTFRQLVDEYLRTGLKKGVPPLFTNLRKLYTDKEKVDTIEELTSGYEKCLLEHNKFALSDSDQQDPTVLLWTQFYLAQHYDHFRRTDRALEYIGSVLEHTPTLIEGYCVKAKIYKHAGCPVEASHWMDEGRTLDTADRYVNSKCAKYLLRANEVAEATDMCGLFTKEGSTPEEDLDSMQCMWFAVESAVAYQRQGMIGEALSKCHQVEKNFSEITEDQFDFHTYCMRKVTLCAYIKLLKLEDRLRSHLFYFKTAKVAIECYLGLHDKPFSERDADDDSGKGNLSAKELKKLKSKQRRAKKKQQVEDEKKVAETKESKDNENKKEEKKEKIDPDALAKTENPLDEAIKFLTPLQMYDNDRIETHLMAFEIYSRKGRPLLMLQSIKRAAKCDPEHPQLHYCLVVFLNTVKKQRASFSPVLTSVLSKQLPTLVDDAEDIERLNGDYLNRHSNSLRAKLSVGKSMLLLDNSKVQEVLQLVTDLSEEQDGRDRETCSSVYQFISTHATLRSNTSAIDEYKRSCGVIFPYAVLFGAPSTSDAVRADREEATQQAHAQKEKSPDIVDELSGGAPVAT